MKEDNLLVKEVLKGNLDSFNILVNKYENVILKFVYNMIRNKEASEDISQEVFITVYNKLLSYNESYKFSNWILQIAKNKTVDYIRKYKRVYESSIYEEVNLKSSISSPEDNVIYLETKRNILKYINNLNEIDKQIIVLKFGNKLTFQSISNILEINESSVKKRYYKIRQKYKEMLEAERSMSLNGM